MNTRIERIKEAIIKKPYIFLFIGVFLGYLGVNTYINQLYVTGPDVLFSSYKISFVIPFIIFTFSVAFLVALVVNLSIIKFKELKSITKASGFGAIGIFAGILGGACPGCFAGLFPAFIGIFGISATLGNLPFFGLEIHQAFYASVRKFQTLRNVRLEIRQSIVKYGHVNKIIQLSDI